MLGSLSSQGIRNAGTSGGKREATALEACEKGILAQVLRLRRALHPNHSLPRQSISTAYCVQNIHRGSHGPSLVLSTPGRESLYLQLSSDPLYKELPAVLSVVNKTLGLDFVPHIAYDVFNLIVRIEIWDLSWEELAHRSLIIIFYQIGKVLKVR